MMPTMDSDDPKQRFQAADALYKQQRYQDALRILDELDMKFPNTRNIMYPRALCLHALGRSDEALNICEFMLVLFNDTSSQELKARIHAEKTVPPDTVRTRGAAGAGRARKAVRYAVIALAAVAIGIVGGKLLQGFAKGKTGASSSPERNVKKVDANKPLYEAEFIFDPEKEGHGHVHGSCIVECPNGDLRVVWYENTPPFPTDQRDRSSDVRIGGSRKREGAKAWNKPFVMDDTPGQSDNNPCMVVDKDKRLWLVHATLDHAPNNTWDSAMVKYKVSSDYEKADVPVWQNSGTLDPKVNGLDTIVAKISTQEAAQDGISADDLAKDREKVKNSNILRTGWMPRAHPLIRSDGTLLLPLASEHFLIAAMAMTSNGGETWMFSAPVPGMGVEQPSLVEFRNGRMIAYLRNNGIEHFIKQTESQDGGMTWTPPILTDLLHPQSGIEAVLLRSGHLAIVYNDKSDDPRDRLALSISEDEGKTWKWTRHIENTPGERFDYPSLIQALDDSLHVTYSYNLKTVKHVRFNEAWVQEGDH